MKTFLALGALAAMFVVSIDSLADCRSIFCEKNCKKRCEESFMGQTYTNNVCYNACLSEEQFCKATLPTTRNVCTSSQYYQPAVSGAKEARRARAVTSFDQCRDINKWVTVYVKSQAGEIGRWLSDSCGCFICEDAFSGGDAPAPSVVPAGQQDADRAECSSLVVRITQVAGGWATAPNDDVKRSIGGALDGLYQEGENFKRRSSVNCDLPRRPN